MGNISSKLSSKKFLEDSATTHQAPVPNTIINFNFACFCLNIRIRGKKETATRPTWDKLQVEEIYVIHPRLVDTEYCGKRYGWREECQVSCLFCQTLVYVVGFQHRTQFSVNSLMGNSGYVYGSRKGYMTCSRISQAMASPYFSPTFQILLCPTSAVAPHYIEPALEHRIYSDFSSIAINRCRQLRVLMIQKPGIAAESAQIIEKKIRSDLNMFIRQLYVRQASRLGRKTLHVILTESLTPVDLELSKRAQLSDSNPFSPPDGSSMTSLWHDLDMLSLAHKTVPLSSQRSMTYPLKAFAFSGDHSTTKCNFTDLPTELALVIFGYMHPLFPCHGIPSPCYYRARSYFAQLTLVSRVWEPLIATVLYRTLIVSFRPAFKTSLPFALERHGACVKTFVVDSSRWHPLSARQGYSVAFERCLELTPTLSSIEFYDVINQFPFDKNDWIRRIAPSLRRQSVKSLTYQTADSTGLSSSLLGLGRDLETLNIQGWCSSSTRFSLPKNLPRLARVSLKDGDVPVRKIISLLSRAGTTRICDGHLFRDSSIRHLSISEVRSLDEAAITQILHVHDIRFHLTRLQIRLHQSREILVGSCRLPLRLLELCPSIIDFSYTSPAPPEIFTHLPQSLQSLELAIINFDSSIIISEPLSMLSSADLFLAYIQTRRPSSSPSSSISKLQRLSVVWRMCSQERPAISSAAHGQRDRRLDIPWGDDYHNLRSGCNDAGVHLDCDFWFEVFHT